MSHRDGSSSSSGAEDIWTKLQRQQQSKDLTSAASTAEPSENENRVVNTHLIFLGDQSSGKSTLIQTFLKPSGGAKETKPTIALDYNFARKTANNVKYIAHIWELGGDLIEPRLLEIPVTKASLPSAAAIICCDLSKPHNVVVSVLRSLSALKEIVKKRSDEIQATSAPLLAEHRERLQTPYKSHADANRVRTLDIQTVIIANKADSLRTLPASERRGLLQMLRFIAHYFGAHLIATSSNDVAARENYRNLINNLCFSTNMRPLSEVSDNSDKPLAVSRGQDTFDAILLGALEAHSQQQPQHRLVNSAAEVDQYLTHKGVTRDVWQRLTAKCAEIFGEADALPSQALGENHGDDLETDGSANGAANDNPFPETEIDDMRSARDAQLQRFILEQERRMEMIAKMR